MKKKIIKYILTDLKRAKFSLPTNHYWTKIFEYVTTYVYFYDCSVQVHRAMLQILFSDI